MIPEGTGYYVGDGLVFSDDLFPHVAEENGEIEGFKRVSATPPPGKRLEEFKERFDFGDFNAHALRCGGHTQSCGFKRRSNDPSVYVSKIQEVTREGAKCHSYATCAAALTDETTINDDIDYEGFSGAVDLDENGDIEGWTLRG